MPNTNLGAIVAALHNRVFRGDSVARRVPRSTTGQATDARTLTGVRGLDRILGGGFLPGSTIMLIGAPGTGKTILARTGRSRLRIASRRCSCVWLETKV